MYQNRRAEESKSYRREQQTPPNINDIYDTLRNLRRRIVLWRVGNAQDPVQFDDLIKEIAIHEIEDNTWEKRHSIKTSLRQNHIPKLKEANAIAVDEQLWEFRPGPKYHYFATIMAFVEELRDGEQLPVAREQFAAQPAENPECDGSNCHLRRDVR